MHCSNRDQSVEVVRHLDAGGLVSSQPRSELLCESSLLRASPRACTDFRAVSGQDYGRPGDSWAWPPLAGLVAVLAMRCGRRPLAAAVWAAAHQVTRMAISGLHGRPRGKV